MRNTRKSTILICAMVIFLGVTFNAFVAGVQPYESYFMYLWADPSSEEPAFSDNFQGMAHDPDNWFISRTSGNCDGGADGEIWKVPVQYNLGTITGSEAGVYDMVLSRDYPELMFRGYWHIGEIDYYKGFVVAPVERCGPSPYTNAIMLFSGDDLGYVGMGTISGWQDLGWVAVNPANGHIYASPDNTTVIEEFEMIIDWDSIPKHPSQPVTFTLVSLGTIQLLDEAGLPMTEPFHNTQGGTFSETGSSFFFLAGIFDQLYSSDGLHAFDTQTWRRVMRSSRTRTTASVDFYYFWDPFWTGGWDEPEGIDVWDLDNDPRSPYWGQLHVGMLDNDADQDDLTIYHYTRNIYADCTFLGDEQGRPSNPFNTIVEAYNLACDGAWIKMAPGTYPDAVTLNKRVKLVPNGGTAIFGAQGRISLTNSTSLNLYSGGGVRLF